MISVIIPTFKEPDYLSICLESAIKGCSNLNNIQLIVVVDGYYDLNKDVLEKYKQHIDILNLPENVGLPKATNLGVYNAKYDDILIVNDDNIFQQNWDIELDVLHFYKNAAKRPIISPNQIEPIPSMFSQFRIKDLGRDPKTFDLKQFWGYCSKIKNTSIGFDGSTLPILMNKQDYLCLGGWDENYPSNGIVCDWDFFLKGNLSGFNFIRLYNCHFYHFVSSTIKDEQQMLLRQQQEREAHLYAKYKWGSFIKHNPENNLKYIYESN